MKSKLKWVLLVVVLLSALAVMGYVTNAASPHSVGCGCGTH